jgi:hypothetical protein
MASGIPELLDCDSLRQDSSEAQPPSSRSRVKETHPIGRGPSTFRFSLLPESQSMQICSFLPSATEILYALGMGESVSGVTFECDYPPEARQKAIQRDTPRQTHPTRRST